MRTAHVEVGLVLKISKTCALALYLHDAEYFLNSLKLLSCSRNPLRSWNPKVHHRIHKRPPSDPTQNQLNTDSNLTPSFS
jgi:hypothetical protein